MKLQELYRRWRFNRLLTKSSFGSPQAKAIRARTPPEVSARFQQHLDQTKEEK